MPFFFYFLICIKILLIQVLSAHLDLVSVHDEASVLRGDVALVHAVGGVVLEHVHHVVQGDEGVVHGNDLGGRRVGGCRDKVCGSMYGKGIFFNPVASNM